MNIPKEHQMNCNTCGEVLDMRDLGEVLSHGQIKDGVEFCKEKEVQYSSSMKIGDSVQWTKDKKPINLN